MLFVATVHFKTDRWLDVQLEYLRRNVRDPYRVFAVLDGLPREHGDKVDRVVPAKGAHSGKLNLLAAEISHEARPDDLIMFLDGDAFPVADPMPTIRAALDRTALIAIRRDENLGERYPHPSFCVIPVREWERLHGDWSSGYPSSSRNENLSDTGSNLLAALERTGTAWTPLLRSNRRNLHQVWFGVYGEILYHHGAGFRPPFSRWDASRTPKRWPRAERLPLAGARIRKARTAQIERWRAEKLEAARDLSEDVYEHLKSDPAFYRKIL